uniref:Disease resistance protein n=1 Tax=Chenopodium quinoa TaxID=63459 RepID=A0A803KUZ6_CHEQI
MLNQLQYLEISNCEVMEAVIGYIGDHEIQMGAPSGQLNDTCTGVEYTHTIFPWLQELKLQHLKNIRSLTQPWFLLVFPTLEHLTVFSCPCLKLPIGPEGLERLIEIQAHRLNEASPILGTRKERGHQGSSLFMVVSQRKFCQIDEFVLEMDHLANDIVVSRK